MSDLESSDDMDEFLSSGEESVNDRGDIEDDERDDDDEVDQEQEEDVEDEDDEDAAPTEVRNTVKSSGLNDNAIPKSEGRESKRKRRNRKSAQVVPEDDVLERAKQARLEREATQPIRVKEFNDDDEDEDNEEDEFSDVEEEKPTKSAAPIQLSVLSTLNPAFMKKDTGAMQFARLGLLGGGGRRHIKRSSYLAVITQKQRGPAVEFKRQKRN